MQHQGWARAVVIALVMAAAAPLLSACNTVSGAGKDVSATGQAVTHSANQVKQGM